jgi:hypothetical protein
MFEKHRDAFQTLQSILAGNGEPATKLLASHETKALIGGKSVQLESPLSTASTFSENLLLEYANGMTGSNLGWGRLTAQNLFQILELHSIYAELMRRTPYLGQAGASNLMAHVVRWNRR